MPARQAVRRPAVRLADYWWVLAAQLRARRMAEPAWGGGDGVPVLLLPGVYEDWGVMASLGRALHRAGHPVHVVPGLGRNAAGLRRSAEVVVARLLEPDLPEVVLVAHSKGGLIGALVMADPRVASRVRRLVAVSTPFAGARRAGWVPTPAVRALRPSARTVRALARVIEPGRVVSLAAAFDPHIPEGCDVVGATNVVLPLDGHFRVLGDRRVHESVLRHVERTTGIEPA